MTAVVAKVIFKALKEPWQNVRVGMTLQQLFALGINAAALCERITRNTLAFRPALDARAVRTAYRTWAERDPELAAQVKAKRLAQLARYKLANHYRVAGRDRTQPPQPPRPCICCKKKFNPSHRFNRICAGCTRHNETANSALPEKGSKK